MTSTVYQAKEALGTRLRELRRDAGLTGRGLAALAGWPNSKVSKIEYGRQMPTENDIRTWCEQCRCPEQTADLIATVRNIEAMYVEWRRRLYTGVKKRQEKLIALEGETRLMRWYEPVLVPGLLQTAEYAAAVLRRVIDFYGVPDDLEAGVTARMERQQVLYQSHHRFHFILAEQALRTRVGDASVMVGQLDRLLTILSLARVSLGIVPTRSAYRVPTNQFILFDDRVVHVEAVSAELAISQPREIALYERAFQELSQQAVYGQRARKLLRTALDEWLL